MCTRYVEPGISNITEGCVDGYVFSEDHFEPGGTMVQEVQLFTRPISRFYYTLELIHILIILIFRLGAPTKLCTLDVLPNCLIV